MPEKHVCVYCDDIIDLAMDDWVVTNKKDVNNPGRIRPKEEWLYAHAECQRKEAAKYKT